MQLSPKQREILEKLGLNATRIQWKLYQWEQKREQMREGGATPTGLRWMKYEHKFCLKCGKLVDRNDKECPGCGRKLPPMWLYRIQRVIGNVAPEGSTPVTYTFVGLCITFFGLMLIMEGLSALMMPSTWSLVVFGGWQPLLMLHRFPWEMWRNLGFGLCHIGILHIGFNCFALTQIGPLVESQTGRQRMLVAITVTQLGAALASYIWYWRIFEVNMTTAGASGWLFGLIGYGVVHFHRLGPSARMYRQALFQWLIYALLFGFVIGANNAAHIGGALAGMALAYLPEPHPRRSPLLKPMWSAAFYVCGLLWLVTLGFLILSIVVNWSPGGIPPGMQQ